MLKDRTGKQITIKEFFQRWKAGIEQIDPVYTLKIQLYSNIIIVIGIVLGLIISLFNIKKFWWIIAILLGSLILQIQAILGILIRLKIYREFNQFDIMEVNENEQQITV